MPPNAASPLLAQQPPQWGSPLSGGFDKQVMIDAVGFAHALRKMSPKQRQQAWPIMADYLVKNEPKLTSLIPKEHVPTDEILDKLLGAQGARTTGQPMTSSGEVIPEQKALATQPLTAPQQDAAQEKIIQSDLDLSDLDRVYDKIKPEDFDYYGRIKSGWLGFQEKAAGLVENVTGLDIDLSPEQKQFKRRRQRIHNQIMSAALIWRKFITGVAGGEKEMEEIINRTLNTSLSPSEAKGALDELYRRVYRDRETYRRLLKLGVFYDGQNQKEYTAAFEKMRGDVGSDINKFIDRFQKTKDPNAGLVDILRYRQAIKNKRSGMTASGDIPKGTDKTTMKAIESLSDDEVKGVQKAIAGKSTSKEGKIGLSKLGAALLGLDMEDAKDPIAEARDLGASVLGRDKVPKATGPERVGGGPTIDWKKDLTAEQKHKIEAAVDARMKKVKRGYAIPLQGLSSKQIKGLKDIAGEMLLDRDEKRPIKISKGNLKLPMLDSNRIDAFLGRLADTTLSATQKVEIAKALGEQSHGRLSDEDRIAKYGGTKEEEKGLLLNAFRGA